VLKTNITQNIQDILQELPESLQTEVLHYIEFLKSNYAQNNVVQNDTKSSEQQPIKHRDGFGVLKGKIWMSEDFDEPLEEMQEYMY